MATELATAYISLAVESKDIAKQINKAVGDVDKGADGKGKSWGSKIAGGMGKTLKAGAVVAGGAVAGVLGTSLVKGFGRLNAIDQAEAKLRGLGHTADGVKGIMTNALAAVKGTAFGLDEAATVAASVVAAGIKPGKDLERVLKLTGDAATIAGTSMGEMGSVFNKVAAGNRLSMAEVNQLSDRGVPIMQMLAEQYGVTTLEARKMVEQGKVDFPAFSKAIEDNIGGAALESGNTFSGAFANMGAALGRLGANLLGGIFPQIKDGFGGVTAALDRLGPVAEKVGEKVGAALAWMIDAGKGLFDLFVKGNFSESFRKAFNIEEDSGVVSFLLGLRDTVIGVFSEIKGGIEAFAAAWKANDGDITSSGFPGLMERIAYWARQVFDYLRDVALPAIGGFIQGFRDGEGPGGKLRGVLEAIGGAMKVAFEWFLAEGLPALQALWKFIQEKLWPDIKRAFIDYIIPAFEAVAESVKVAWENWIQPSLKAMWSFIKDVLAPFLADFYENGVKPTFKLIADAISFAWNYVIKPVFENLGGGLTFLVTAFTEAKDGIKKVWDKLTDAISGPLDKARTFINDKFIKPLNSMFEKLGMTIRIPTISVGFSAGGAVGIASHGGPQMVFAAGGRVPGYSPTATADNIPAWLTAGEYVLPVNSTKRLMAQVGSTGMEMLRRGQIPGYALGGLVDWAKEKGSAAVGWVKEKGTDIIDLASKAWDVARNPAKFLRDFASKALAGIGDSPLVQAMAAGARKIIDALIDKVKAFFAPEDGGGNRGGNGMGWQAMRAWFEATFPGKRITSGYRPGAVSITGIKSDHALGRAIDMPASMAIFNKIDSTWKNIRQLLYSPAGPRQIRGGRRSDTIGSPLRAQHWDHVHWAMADGGLVKPFVADSGVTLAPGINVVHNKLGRPEPLARTDQMPERMEIAGTLDLGDGMTAALRGVADFTQMSGLRSRMAAGVRS